MNSAFEKAFDATMKASDPFATGTAIPVRSPSFRATMKGPDGKVIFDTDVSKDAADQIATALKPFKPKQARSMMVQVWNQLREQDANSKKMFYDNLRQLNEVEAKVGMLKEEIAILDELKEWGSSENGGLILQRATDSLAHSLMSAFRDGKVAVMTVKDGSASTTFCTGNDAPLGQSFVVEHDWASAFKHSEEFTTSDDYALPYETTCFEFQVSGKRVIASLYNAIDGAIEGHWYVKLSSVKDAWLHSTDASQDSVWNPLKRFIKQHVKAICIALEAKVAITEIVRAPYRLNARRETVGKLPVQDHHVVKLASRVRSAPLPDGFEKTPGRRKRLHFRRGHWRHYPTHKVRINWMLVGDPDLGFVDKEYRL